MPRSQASIPGQVQLVSSSGDSLAASPASGSSQLALPPSFLNRFAVNQVSCPAASLEEAVMASVNTGISGIGLLRQKAQDFGLEKASYLLHEKGMRPTSYSWTCGFSGSMGFTFNESIQDGRETVREAAMLGAKTVIAVTGSRNKHTRPHWNRIVCDALRSIGDEAGRWGISLAVMPMSAPFEHLTYLNRLDDTLELLDRVKHPNVGMTFDAYHWCDHPKIARIIADVAPVVRVVQLSDRIGAPSSDDSRLLPGSGFLPLGEVVKLFLANDYPGDFELAAWSREVWQCPVETSWLHCRGFAGQVFSLLKSAATSRSPFVADPNTI